MTGKKARGQLTTRVDRAHGKINAAWGGGQQFQGARSWDPNRTRVWYPQMDPAVTVRMARAELARKSCWAFDNSGFIRGLLVNAARMCGVLKPRATSGNAEWDESADAAWEQATGNPLVFDVAGKICGEDLPSAVLLTRFKLGDGLIVFGEAESGRPRISFIEGWQIGDAQDESDREKWVDGVRVDRYGRARKVRLVKDGAKVTDIDLADAIYFAEYERPGQVRGLPSTYHLILDCQDSEEIQAFWKGGIKAASMVGMQIVGSRQSNGMPLGLGHAVTRNTKSRTEAGGVTTDAVYNQTQIVELGDERIELLHDDRPSPNAMEFLDYLKRQMALGFGLPVEVIWNLAALGGANTRAVLLAAQSFIDRQHAWFRQCVGRRLWTWVVAKAIKAGDVPAPPAGLEWWRHDWLPGARLSVDFSRDGRTYLEMLERGELSPSRWYGWQGLRAEDEDARTVADYARRMALCDGIGVPVEAVFSPAPGGAAPPAPAAAGNGGGNRDDQDEEADDEEEDGGEPTTRETRR